MWRHSKDNSEAIITAEKHIRSSHKGEEVSNLPPRAVIFCIGSAMDYVKEYYNTKIITKKIPKFIGGSECLVIEGYPNICFVHGGYGAPAIADTVETLIALGVKEIILIGMCGGFAERVNVGDVLIPNKILSEEGTSLHYFEDIEFVTQSPNMVSKAVRYYSNYFNTYQDSTVTTDAVYRQTFYKEDYWRKLGCSGIDMEASALLSVSRYHGIESNVILLVSDKHPRNIEDKAWNWGNSDFNKIKKQFIEHSVKYSQEVL